MSIRISIALATCTSLAACELASPDPGSGATLIVPGAQFVPGSMAGDQGGPAVASVQNFHNVVVAGSIGERFKGALERGATAVLLGLDGDAGYWVLTAGIPDPSEPDFPTFDVRVSFGAGLPPGPFDLVVQAADRTGRVGPERRVALEALEADAPAGELVFSLQWDRNADLDLHVITPDGIEIWSGNTSSYEPPPPGAPPEDPSAWMDAGILDGDSNAACVIDGRRRESVVWSMPPPAGRYLVRVDANAMCGQPHAYWQVDAVHLGEPIGTAHGLALESDTRFPHGAGAGVTALEVEVP